MDTKYITKGTVKTNLEVYEFSKGWNVIEVGCDDAENSPMNSKWICQVNCVNPEEIEENKANAELICEAFNVAKETGLSPTQIRDRIKELERILEVLLEKNMCSHSGDDMIELALNNKQK